VGQQQAEDAAEPFVGQQQAEDASAEPFVGQQQAEGASAEPRLKRPRAEPGGFVVIKHPEKDWLYLRISMDPHGNWFFRAVCTHCSGTKSATCKSNDIRLSSSQKLRGQGRPGGLCWGWVVHAAETLEIPHSILDHRSYDPSFICRTQARALLLLEPGFDDYCASLERPPSPGRKPKADDPDTLEPWDIPTR